MPSKSPNKSKAVKISFSLEIYRGKDAKWYWRWSRASKIMANSDQGYSRRIDCARSAASSQALSWPHLSGLLTAGGDNASGHVGTMSRFVHPDVAAARFQRISIRVTP